MNTRFLLIHRWAVKEAAYKALGHQGIRFNEIQVLASRQGIRSPIHLQFVGKAKDVIEKEKILVQEMMRCYE